MKTKFLFVAAAVLFGAALMSTQLKPNDDGTLSITVLADGNPSSGALVGVSASYEDLENSNYVYEGETNGKGVISFSHVAPGNYYVDAAHEGYYGEGKITVGDGEATLTIKMTADEEE